jgi:hypothetical protein
LAPAGVALFGVRRFSAALFCFSFFETTKKESGGKAPHSKKGKAAPAGEER